jgi:hypothetical protein
MIKPRLSAAPGKNSTGKHWQQKYKHGKGKTLPAISMVAVDPGV